MEQGCLIVNLTLAQLLSGLDIHQGRSAKLTCHIPLML